MREKLTHYIRAGYAGIYLVSHEEQRVEAELKAIAASLKHRLFAWSATAGLIDTNDGASRGAQDPMEVLGLLAELPEDSIVLLRDYHLFFDDPNPILLRQLKDQLRAGKTKGHTIAVLGCRLRLPPELEREFIVVDFTLPGAEALDEVLKGILKSTGKKRPSPEATAALINAARGLTTNEAEDAFALSVVECGELNAAVIAREKAQAVKKNGLLELIETRESLDSIGGLDLLKDWLLKRCEAFTPRAKEYGLPMPKGVLMLGIPGCGKSLTAKATASVFGVPLLRLYAGQAAVVTSRSLRRLLAMAQSFGEKWRGTAGYEISFFRIQAVIAKSYGECSTRAGHPSWARSTAQGEYVVSYSSLPLEVLAHTGSALDLFQKVQMRRHLRISKCPTSNEHGNPPIDRNDLAR